MYVPQFTDRKFVHCCRGHSSISNINAGFVWILRAFALYATSETSWLYTFKLEVSRMFRVTSLENRYYCNPVNGCESRSGC